ncbi:MAG: hypothetical protein ACTSVW_01620, partial [Candidatus Njordarchaeales archaeon]
MKGYLLLVFNNVKNVEDVGWIVILFINKLKEFMREHYDIVDDQLISIIREIYSQLISEIQYISNKLSRISKYFMALKKVIGSEAPALLRACSEELISQ